MLYFCQKQRGKIGLIKGYVTEDWDLQAYEDLNYLKHSFDLNGVELGDLDQSYSYVELAEVFWLHAISSALLRGKPAHFILSLCVYGVFV